MSSDLSWNLDRNFLSLLFDLISMFMMIALLYINIIYDDMEKLKKYIIGVISLKLWH